MRTIHLPGFVFVGALFFVGAIANAQLNYFTISGGYSHVYGLRDNTLFHNKDGPYFDADFAWQVPSHRLPLLLGVGLSGSGYFDQEHTDVPFDDDFFDRHHLSSDLSFFEIEPRIGLAFWSRGVRGLFLKPRVGFGLLINDYTIDERIDNNGSTFFRTHYHDGAAVEVHPALQAGYAWRYPGGMMAAGGEVSYMPAWGDFGRFGSHVQEIRAGAFFTVRF
jgi:hypothetical protein